MGLRFTRVRGLLKNGQNATMIFACHNLKKMANWRWKSKEKVSLISKISTNIENFMNLFRKKVVSLLNLLLCQQTEANTYVY